VFGKLKALGYKAKNSWILIPPFERHGAFREWTARLVSHFTFKFWADVIGPAQKRRDGQAVLGGPLPCGGSPCDGNSSLPAALSERPALARQLEPNRIGTDNVGIGPKVLKRRCATSLSRAAARFLNVTCFAEP
jgi:hypothetical protein